MEGLLCYLLLNYYSSNGHYCSYSQEYVHKHNTDFERQVHVPLNLQKKYFVFEDAIISLFEKCENRSSTTTNITKTTIGTVLHVKQQCQCGHIRHWESQPFVRNTPAGNIILSAFILFAGASPSKTLRVLEFFGCPSISTRTIFRHQSVYLQPTVWSVWEHHQSRLLAELKSEHRKLILGGDGRADSPGHCKVWVLDCNGAA